MSDQSLSVIGQSIMPAMAAEQARERYRQLHEFIASQMKEGTDYGSIPGMEERKDPKTGEILPPKKNLFKPGAEKLSSLFALRPRFVDVQVVEDWTGKDHDGEKFFYYREKCCLWRGDDLICDADGSCNSMEKKYRYRQAARKCPSCGKETIIKGKKEYGGGWICWKQRGGCGMKFFDGEAVIEDQESGQVLNPDIADQANTILKMAQKRALIAAILIAANASDYFTQDDEEEEKAEEPKVVDLQPVTVAVKQTETIQKAPIKRPYEPEIVKQGIDNYAEKHAKVGTKASEKFRGLVCGVIEMCFEGEDAKTKEKKRHSILNYLTGKDSIKDIPDWYIYALQDWLNWTEDSGGLILINSLSIKEAHKIIEKVTVDAGQKELPQ